MSLSTVPLIQQVEICWNQTNTFFDIPCHLGYNDIEKKLDRIPNLYQANLLYPLSPRIAKSGLIE